MGDERPAPVPFVGGGDRPRVRNDAAILVEDVETGRIVQRFHFPGRLAELERDRPDFRKLPYTFRRIVLTAAGDQQIDFEGDYFMVMRMAGVIGAGAELRAKFNTEGTEWISIRNEIVLPMAYDRIYLQWDVIANGEVDILLGTRGP